MDYNSTLKRRHSHDHSWTLPRGSSFDAFKLLRYSLICMLVMLCGGSAMAEDVTVATGTFNGKNGTYSEGWSTTGTGKNRTDCIIIGSGENITSPSLDLSKYTKVTISIKARRFGSLSDSKATIDASINGTSVGTTDATGTNATASLTDIVFTPTTTMTAVNIVFTCTNATSAGSTHGAGINTITITGTKASAEDTRTTTALIFDGEYQTTGDVGGSMGLPTALVKTVVDGVQTGTLNEPTITWTSSNTAVATIDGTTINFVGAGKSTITASFAGDETQYKPSSNSFELTVASIADPVISPSTGTFNETQNITISCATSGATIYYTTDGSDPSASNGTVYTTPIEVSETTTIKAIAVKGEFSSAITESIIRISKPFTLPWSEDWSGYAANDIPSGHSSYYAETDGGTNTKIYAESLADGTSPELLISKTNGTFTVTEFDLSSLNGEAATLLLQFNANGVLTLSTTTEGVTIGTATNVGNVYSCRIAIPAGTTKLDLTLKNATSKNIRVDNFSLAVSNAPKAPTFDPAPGTYYTGQNVAISCETEGADIYKSTDGENFSKYTSSFPVTSFTTVYAYAEKDGEKSETVSATYIIGSSYDGFAAMQEEVAAEGFTDKAIRYRATGGMTVTFVNGKNAYLLDGSGNGMLAFNNSGWGTSLTAGQKMNYADGYLTATLTKYNGNAELKDITFPEMTGGTVTVTPVEKTLPMTSANQSQLVTLKGLTYNSSDQTLSDGTNSIKYYNNFKINPAPTLEDGKQYDVTGIVVMYNENIEICPRTADDVSEVAITVEKPVVNGNPETAAISFLGSVEVALTSDTEGAAIYYTLDGTDPTAESTLYSEAITINGSCTLKAVAILNGVSSEITTIELEQNPLYILGVEDKNNDNNTWSLPADLTPMTWDAENQVYTYSLKNTTTAYFCIANGGTGLADDAWETFNSTYRYSLGEDNINGILNEELQLIKTTAPNSCIVLEPGEYVISVTKEYNKITITGEATIIPPTEDTYVVAGTPEAVFGTEWAGSAEGNKLTKDEETGLYTKTFENVEIAANTTIGYKIVKNGSTWIPDGTGNEHTFTIEEAGTYNITVTFNATSLDYDMTATKVGGDEPTYPITATWDFRSNANPRAEAFFNGTSGTLASNVDGIELNIDATNGKFDSKENRTGDAQANEGTIIKVPVGSTKDQITIVGNWKVNYKIGAAETAITDEPLNYTYTATAADVKEGFVTITSTSNNNYFYSITLVKNEPEEIVEPTYPITATWDFTQNADPRAAAFFNGTSGTLASNVDGIELSIDATNGKFDSKENRTGDAQVNEGTIIKVPVGSTKDQITIVGNWKVNYKIGAAETAITDAPLTYTYTATAADVKEKFVIITSTNDNNYFYSITLVKNEPEEIVEPTYPITATWDFAKNCAELAAKPNGTFTGTSMASNVESISMSITYGNGQIKNNDNSYQITDGVSMQIPVKNVGDEVIVKGYPSYSHYTVGNITIDTKSNDDTPDATYKAKASDVKNGYVTVASTNNNNYIYSITVIQYAPKEPVTLDNEEVTATFPFNLGTEGQTATFSNADYWLKSKAVWGSNFTANGTRTVSDITETQLKAKAKETTAAESNLIKFAITPKPGFTFTPTKVTFTATRIGTDDGALDVAWLNSDKTTATLANMKKADGNLPARENKDPNHTTFTYDLTKVDGIVAGEGECGLVFNLYSINADKNYGFANIIIEGTLSGTEKEVPILASFKANGTAYSAEEVFGDEYESTIELSKTENMVNENNPLTEITASNGEVGTVTYTNSTENSCTVTIPVTAGETTMNYVLNVIRKPDFTLTYLDVKGQEIGTQIVEKGATIGEFAYDIADVEATKEGYKARGWFKQNSLGEKFTIADVITSDTKLYALQTEIEVSSLSRTYDFDLTKKTFYAEDHEAFNPSGVGFYWHDNQHGWAFKKDNKIELLVGPKANIQIALCQHSKGTNILVKKDDQLLETLPAASGTDGATVSYQYEGEPGIVTLELTIDENKEMYIHGVTIVNNSETNYDKQGDWIIVKKGDSSSLLDAIKIANGIEGTKIFLPNGTYDLDETVKTIISGKKISLIGQSAENTIITNRPPVSMEGLDKADLLKNTGEELYMQDITLKNDMPYTGNDARASSLHDTGTKTICKNVNLWSHQDTYYSHKAEGLFYFEGGELHGTVDYLCGSGKVYFNECLLVNEKRSSATISANSELYVFNNCTIENNADSYNFGRAWSNTPVCVFLNTTLKDPASLIGSRWNLTGINVDYQLAGEYGTKNGNGDDITPAENIVTFTKNNTQMNTILNGEQANTYTINYVLGDWAAIAQQEAKQLEAPNASYENGTVTWTPANNGAIAYALFKNGEFVGITTDSQYAIDINPTEDELTIRAANSRGGFGPENHVSGTTKIDGATVNQQGEQVIYNMQGVRVSKAQKGVYIINGRKVVVK